MATTAEIIAALAALGMIDDAPASVPVAARAASPFAGATRSAVAGQATDSRPAILHGLPLRDARAAAAIHALAGYSCSIDAEWRNAAGQPYPDAPAMGAAHGFATPRNAGDPCPHTDRTGACPGVIR